MIDKREHSLSIKQNIAVIILVISLLILFFFLFMTGTNIIVAFLIILFLFLFFFGLIFKGKEISLSAHFFSSKTKEKSFRAESKKQYKTEIHKTDRNNSLDFTYHRPLIRKCPNCGMILTRNMRKCPNCQKPID